VLWWFGDATRMTAWRCQAGVLLEAAQNNLLKIFPANQVPPPPGNRWRQFKFATGK
jgi:hypothetical protein